MGNYTQAIEEFNAVIDNYPRTDWAARAQYNIGDAYYNVSQYQDAIQAYKKVLDNYPRSSYIIDAVNGIQFAQFASGQADSSGYMLEELVQNHPNQRTADRLRYRMATNLLQSGDYNGAVSAFEDYIRKTPYSSNLPDAYYNLAEAYRLNDKEQKSIESYKYLLERFPQSDRAPTAHSDLADIYVRRGELDQALEQYRQLRDNFNDYRIEGIVGMGRINRMNGDLSKARELYEEGLSIDAENTALTLGIAALNVEERRFDEALENLRPIAENSSNENGAEAQYLIGEVFRAQGNYNQAIDAYTNVKLFYEAYQNWVAKALFGSAKCYEQLGNPGEANNTLRTIVESYPETIEAIQAQQMLNQQN
jgi:TolA-binding protein